ncbi:hypothetical protein [Halolamina salina]|uniref:Uncharacterized protein n=1 Tax=Halolamina salina TaxID=1220023 RepID=A0ABD6BBJ9_9EURY
MATKSQTESGRTAEFVIDPTERLDAESIDDETPTHVLVQVSSNGRSQMAIVAAGAAGRWSFDFQIDSSGIEVERAFEEGIRTNVEDLPAWMVPVKDAVAGLVLSGQ